jgi:2-polyprenyl-6-methoxyphenol hydroxylase-like FAD-dependent oxidoreductase
MDLVGIRTMEHCRRWGIVADVENSPYPRDLVQDNIYLTHLGGYELGRERFAALGEDSPPPVSPQKRERCPQNMFDPILRKFASSQPTVSLRYRTRLVSFKQEAARVDATLEDLETGRRYEMTADFLVGCDGAHSAVRESLGIPMSGTRALTYTTNVIFRCEGLTEHHGTRRGYRYIFIGPEGTWATIVAINGCDQWRLSIIGSSEPRELTAADIDAAIRRTAGKPVEYEILSVVPWVRRELVAEEYGQGRVFIAGDAVHVMSPTGAYGMNTGIADAVDLSWKLAAMLEGWGGQALLSSYNTERRPIGLRNVSEASRNLRRMLSPGINLDLLEDTSAGAETRKCVGEAMTEIMKHEWFTLGMHLGYRYENSPICVPDGTQTTPDDPRNYIPTARPGSRAPHVWLADGRSTLDLFGRSFALLQFNAEADPTPLLQAANGRGMPVELVRIDDPKVLAAYERMLVLVRPDGHVAWRADRIHSDALYIVDVVRGAVPADKASGTVANRAHRTVQVQ